MAFLIIEFISGRLENIAVKGKKCMIEAFPPFLTIFSKAFYLCERKGMNYQGFMIIKLMFHKVENEISTPEFRVAIEHKTCGDTEELCPTCIAPTNLCICQVQFLDCHSASCSK